MGRRGDGYRGPGPALRRDNPLSLSRLSQSLLTGDPQLSHQEPPAYRGESSDHPSRPIHSDSQDHNQSRREYAAWHRRARAAARRRRRGVESVTRPAARARPALRPASERDSVAHGPVRRWRARGRAGRAGHFSSDALCLLYQYKYVDVLTRAYTPLGLRNRQQQLHSSPRL